MNGVRKDEDVAALGVHRVADACSVSRSWRSDAWAAATHLSPPELPCRLVVAFALPCLASFSMECCVDSRFTAEVDAR